jgi:alpha-ketoglutarate-dependent taurine dioxygenase
MKQQPDPASLFSGTLGAVIHNVNLSVPLDASVVNQIRATLIEFKVVFFRDQFLTPTQQVCAFLSLHRRYVPRLPVIVTDIIDMNCKS